MALRSHRQRPLRTLLTIFGVTTGVALMFVTAALDSTVRATIEANAGTTGGRATIEVVAPVAGISRADWEVTRSTAGVETAVPAIQTTTRLRTATGDRRVLVLGVPASFSALFPEAQSSLRSLLQSLATPRSILFGPALDGQAGNGPSPRLQTAVGEIEVEPVGTLAPVPFAGIQSGDFLLLRLAAARKYFSGGRWADTVYVSPEDNVSTQPLRETLARRLEGRAVVTTPVSQAETYKDTYASLSHLTGFVALVSLLVAMFVVLNTMTMSLRERRRDISLLSSLGVARVQLIAGFLAEALALGLIAAGVGIAAGYVLGSSLLEHVSSSYPFLNLPSARDLHLTFDTVAYTCILSVGVAILGSVWPIWQTLKASPVEGMSPDAAYEWQAKKPRRSSLMHWGRLFLILVLGVFTWQLASGRWMSTIQVISLLAAMLLSLPFIIAGCLGGLRQLLRLSPRPLGALAIGSLKKNPRRTATTTGVLAISTSLVIGLGIALGSFESEATRIFQDRYGPPLYVTADSYSGFISDQPMQEDVIGVIERVPGVRSIYPFRYRSLIFRGRQALVISAPMVREAEEGFSNALANTYGAPRQDLIAGLRKGGIVLSAHTSTQHRIPIGANLALPGAGRSAKVVGVYEDVSSIDAMYLERSAYIRLSGDRSADRIAIASQPGLPTSVLRERLERVVSARGVPAIVETREQVVGRVTSSITDVFSVTRALQLAVLLIAALIVANTMLTTVAERRWEFALCRALGMRRGQIRGQVVLEASIIGGISAVVAAAVGMAMGSLMLNAIRARLDWQIGFKLPLLTLVAVGAAVAVAMIAALLPAYLAGRRPVLDTMRRG